MFSMAKCGALFQVGLEFLNTIQTSFKELNEIFQIYLLIYIGSDLLDDWVGSVLHFLRICHIK
jgi:hypothetical protein